MFNSKLFNYQRVSQIGFSVLLRWVTMKADRSTNISAICKRKQAVLRLFWGFHAHVSLVGDGWWFQPLRKILVSWDDYSQYMGK